ncbi:hypothetical protein Tco_1212807 [Tanacetum coccineum]
MSATTQCESTIRGYQSTLFALVVMDLFLLFSVPRYPSISLSSTRNEIPFVIPAAQAINLLMPDVYLIASRTFMKFNDHLNNLNKEFPDGGDSCARSFTLHPQEFHILSFILGIQYRIFTKGRKTKPNQTKPSTDLERARKSRSKAFLLLITIILKRRVVAVPLLMKTFFLNMNRFTFDLSNDHFPPADRSDLYHEEFADELTHIMSLPNLECFKFKIEPDPGDLTSINLGIRKNVSTTNVNVPLGDDQSPLIAYIVWIFLAFLTYPVVPPYLLSTGNEDTIYGPRISVYSCMPMYLIRMELQEIHNV